MAGESSSSLLIKYGSLVVLVLQNTMLVMVLRISRTGEGPKYAPSTAVAIMECCKLVTCLGVIASENGFSMPRTFAVVRYHTIESPKEVLKLCVPSFLYVVQNNLLYYALSNLDAVVYQMCYQLKILTTAVLSVVLLRKHVASMQWAALIMLTVGVAFVQTSGASSGGSGNESEGSEKENNFMGFMAVLGACCTSGYAGVYFERVLKKSQGEGGRRPPSLWERNIQMGLSSTLIAFTNVVTKDGASVSANGFFYGYNNIVACVIFLQAFGGLTVAVVVKYADNILKGFAASYSIVTSLILEMLFFDFQLTPQFVVGGILVNVSSYMYGKFAPSSMSGPQVHQLKYKPLSAIDDNDEDEGTDVELADHSLKGDN